MSPHAVPTRLIPTHALWTYRCHPLLTPECYPTSGSTGKEWGAVERDNDAEHTNPGSRDRDAGLLRTGAPLPSPQSPSFDWYSRQASDQTWRPFRHQILVSLGELPRDSTQPLGIAAFSFLS